MTKDILVVDVPEHPLHALVQALGEAGYLPNVLWADDNPGGRFGERHYELVFINLEADAAKSVCDGIRSHPEGAITPIIFVGTGSQVIRSPADALSAGGDYYFSAPCDLQRVLAKVQTYLGPGSPAATPAATAPVSTAPSAPPSRSDDDTPRSTLTGPADALLAQIASREAEMARREQESAEARVQAQRLAEQHRVEEQRQAEARRQLEDMRRAEEIRQGEVRRMEEVRRAETRRLEDMRRMSQAVAPDPPAARQAPAAATRPDAATPRATRPDAEPEARAPQRPAEPERRGPKVVAAPVPEPPADGGRADVPMSDAAPAAVPRALEPQSGALSLQTDMATLLALAWRQRVTGRIDVVAGQRKKSLFMHEGAPVDAESSQPFDRIEEYLSREGKITRAQYQTTRLKRLDGARQVGAFLVSEGHLKPQELFESVRGHLAEQVYGLFEWEEGTFDYVDQPCDEADRITLDMDPRALIIEGIRRKYLLSRLTARIGSPSSLAALTPDAAETLPVLKLSGRELAVARLLDGQRNLEDVVFTSGLEALRVYQVVAGLVSVGAAEVLVRGIDGFSRDDPQGERIDRERIADKAEQARNVDYFEMLGITRNATPYEVEHALDHVAQQFDKARFGPQVQRDMITQLQEIAEVLADARDVLSDASRKEAYARHSETHRA